MTSTEPRPKLVPCRHGLRHERMAVMFVDLDHFMRTCIDVPVEDVFVLVEAFQRIVTDTVSSFSGEINAYQGDGVLVTFCELSGRTDCATRALRCAWKILERIGALNVEQRVDGDRSISASIGLQYGEVSAGTIAVSKRFGPTLIGDALNVAVRLEQHAHALGTKIVVGHDLIQRARFERASGVCELGRFVDAGSLSLGGRGDPINVWVQAKAAKSEPDTPEFLCRRTPEARVLGPPPSNQL
jgi:class 3 adenylate cyclase